MIRKFISELVGTFLLVFIGCGTAVVCGVYTSNVTALSVIPVALAFGLILMALAYTIGKVSGAHVNPAVSIAMAIDKRIDIIECVEYILAQIIGAIAGSFVLSLIMGSTATLGANGFEMLSSMKAITTQTVAITVEVILTFVFVLVVLTTTKEENKNAGIIIGLTLTLVHIFGIPLTGTSVNPARSLAPALLTGGTAFSQVWVFIVAPFAGGILAALFYKFVINYEQKKATKTSKK